MIEIQLLKMVSLKFEKNKKMFQIINNINEIFQQIFLLQVRNLKLIILKKNLSYQVQAVANNILVNN